MIESIPAKKQREQGIQAGAAFYRWMKKAEGTGFVNVRIITQEGQAGKEYIIAIFPRSGAGHWTNNGHSTRTLFQIAQGKISEPKGSVEEYLRYKTEIEKREARRRTQKAHPRQRRGFISSI